MRILLFVAFFALYGCSDSSRPSQPVAPNSPPVLSVAERFTIAENTENFEFQIGVIDPDGDDVAVSLTGPDAARFQYVPDRLAVVLALKPNFEIPSDADGDNRYELQISATDGALSASASVVIEITEVDELPSNLQSLQIEPNKFDAILAIAELKDGGLYIVEGSRDDDGNPTRIEQVQFFSADNTEKKFPDVVMVAQQGRLQKFRMNDGSELRFQYSEEGDLTGLIALSAKGGAELQIPLSLFLAGQLEAATNSIASKSGFKSVSTRASVPSYAYAGTGATGAGPVASPAQQLTLPPAQDNLDVTVNVQKCGRPVSDAGVNVYVQTPQDVLRRTAVEVSTGAYQAKFPISRDAGSVEENCNSVFEPLNLSCEFSEPFDPGIILLGCTTIGVGLDAATAFFGVIGDSQLYVPACITAFSAWKVYCDTLGYSGQPGAPAVGSAAFCAGATLLERNFTPATPVTVSAQVLIPGSEVLATEPVGSSASSQVVLTAQGTPEIRIADFYTTPARPLSFQSYTATAEIDCASNTLTRMDIVGTDGYQGEAECVIAGAGECNLVVPGAESGVEDRITVEADTARRQISIVFE